MTTIVLVLALVGALACPLHMLWATRRGRPARCRPVRAGRAESLEARQRHLAERVERLTAGQSGGETRAPTVR